MVKFLIYKLNSINNFLFKKFKYNNNYFITANSKKIIDKIKDDKILEEKLKLRLNKKLNINTKLIDFKNKIFQKYFTVDVNKICSDTGKKIFDKNFPLHRTSLQLYENNFSYQIRNTFLYEYINSFQPNNYAEVFKIKNPNHLFNSLSQYSKFYPWMHSLPQRHLFAGLFGPKENIFIEMTIIRLTNLIRSFIKYSYLPSENDIIMGYFLIKNNDYRFVVTSGMHRTSVLLALYKKNKLNLDHFICKFDHIRIKKEFYFVNIKDIKLWPAVKKGYISIKDAREHFNSYFNQ